MFTYESLTENVDVATTLRSWISTLSSSFSILRCMLLSIKHSSVVTTKMRMSLKWQRLKSKKKMNINAKKEENKNLKIYFYGDDNVQSALQ